MLCLLIYLVCLFELGPIFIFTWPWFSNAPSAATWAAIVPLSMTIKFVLIGLGILIDEDAISSISRTGDRKELLKGPLYYGLVFSSLTYMYWKEERALLCFMTLCCGDGFAELVGRKYGRSNLLPWSCDKSWAGSISFVVTSVVSTLAMQYLVYCRYAGFESLTWSEIIPRTIFISVIAATVESFHTGDADNIIVSGAAVLADWLYCSCL